MVAGVVAVAGPIYLVYARFGECRSAAASVAWPRATAEITAAGVEKLGLWRPAFLPTASYRFTANGREQTGSRIAFRSLATRDPKEAQASAGQYPMGAKVKVAYDPVDPHDSVLEPGPEGTKVLTFDVIRAFTAGVFVLLVTLLL
jgi:Protein of unknown function (DUF3592)